MKIAITSPAGKVDKKKIEKGIAFFKSKGCDLLIGQTIEAEEYWTAGSAEMRAAELEAFWKDDSVDVLWAARGGFGCAHLLDLLNWPELKSFSKVLCGHSDISVLHLAFMAKGLSRTVSSAMPAVEFSEDEVDEFTLKTSFDLLESESLVNWESFSSCKILREGEIDGSVIPVTLSVLVSLLGTAYLPCFENSILVLEDVNEAPYRIDAYLNQLRLSGILSSLGGLVFGDFNNCGSASELDYVFRKYASCISGPVLYGLPFGHCIPRLSLPVGATISIKVTKNKILL